MFLSILNMIGVVLFVFFFFSFCVFIHELGHFLAAKWCGLHINAFSIGFKKAWGKTVNGVEYRIGWLPFGGYVDLPQVDATGADIVDEDGNPLPPGKPSHRIITAVAGPLFNILFGLALGCIVWTCGAPEETPVLDSITVKKVEEGAPSYKAGLRTGDVITKVDGETVNYTWKGFINEFLVRAGEVSLTYQRDGKEQTISYQPEKNPKFAGSQLAKYSLPWFTPSIPAIVNPKLASPAYKAGVKAGDKVVEMNGEKIADLIDLEKVLVPSKQQKFTMVVERNGDVVTIPEFDAAYSGQSVYMVGTSHSMEYLLIVENVKENASKSGLKNGDRIVKLNGEEIENHDAFELALSQKEEKSMVSLVVERDGKEIALDKIQIAAKDSASESGFTVKYKLQLEVKELVEGGAAQSAGVKAGDIITQVNGKELVSYPQFTTAVKGSKGKEFKITVLRDGESKEIALASKQVKQYEFGFKPNYMHYPTPVEQLVDVVKNSYRTVSAIGVGLMNKAGFSKRKTSLELSDLSGPVGIVKAIGNVVYYGSYLKGLGFIVLITFSLGILNLLPLPVLDGGHIVMALIQMVIRRPLPGKLINPLMNAFAMLLISFMLYVTVFDVMRVFGIGNGGDEAQSFEVVLSE